MDDEAHKKLYAAGYEMRKRVVGEDYVAKSLEGKGDFGMPLVQFATVCLLSFPSLIAPAPYNLKIRSAHHRNRNPPGAQSGLVPASLSVIAVCLI